VELLCASEVKVPSKIVNAALDQKVLVSKSALKKDVNAALQSMGDKLVARMATLKEQVTQERKKRAELEAEIALLKSSKDDRGPAMGASHRNQNLASTTPTVHFETQDPPAN
jgi:Skp family chaperone for outer membrane proteins